MHTLRRHCEETISDQNVSVDKADANCKQILDYITDLTGGKTKIDSKTFESENKPDETF